MAFDFTDETRVAAELKRIAKPYDRSVQVVIATRNLTSPRSLILDTKFLLIVTAGNFELIKALLKATIDTTGSLVFEDTELDFSNGNMEIDKVYMRAKIAPKFN